MVDAGIRMFYLLSCTSMWTLWGTLSFLVGRDFHIRGSCAAVAVRPSWLPGCYLQSLLQSRTYLIFCHAAPVSLAIAAVNPESCLFRSIAAVFVGLYALVCGPCSIIAHIIAYKCCSRLVEQEKCVITKRSSLQSLTPTATLQLCTYMDSCRGWCGEFMNTAA
jgi:hypothetical protein